MCELGILFSFFLLRFGLAFFLFLFLPFLVPTRLDHPGDFWALQFLLFLLSLLVGPFLFFSSTTPSNNIYFSCNIISWHLFSPLRSWRSSQSA